MTDSTVDFSVTLIIACPIMSVIPWEKPVHKDTTENSYRHSSLLKLLVLGKMGKTAGNTAQDAYGIYSEDSQK